MELEVPAWAAKLLYAIATGTVIGGGTMVLQSHESDARQDLQIEQLHTGYGRIDTLSDKLDETNANLAKLNGYLEGRNDALRGTK